MAFRWTAGANAFGAAGDLSWGSKNPSFNTDGGKTEWHPGTDSFGVGAQTGGVWVPTGARSTGDELVNSSTAADSFSSERSFALLSNSSVPFARTPQMKSSSLLSARSMGMQVKGRTGSGSFGGSSPGRSRRTNGSFRYPSRSFGAGRTTRGQISGKRRAYGSFRRSFTESSDEKHRIPHLIARGSTDSHRPWKRMGGTEPGARVIGIGKETE
jgi:hypothetical protein